MYDPEWVQTVPSVPHKGICFPITIIDSNYGCLAGDKPNLRQLQRLCKGCSKVTVLKNIAPKWQELAIEMGFEYSDIEIVDMETDKNPMNAVRKILGRWLEGTVTTDTRPLTWSTLVECLSNIECQSLADELSQILLD